MNIDDLLAKLFGVDEKSAEFVLIVRELVNNLGLNRDVVVAVINDCRASGDVKAFVCCVKKGLGIDMPKPSKGVDNKP